MLLHGVRCKDNNHNRGKIMAAITPRTNDKGVTVWRVSIRQKGHKPVYKTFKNKLQAKRWASKTETQIADGEYLDTTQADGNYICDLCQRYIDEVLPQYAASTQESGGKRFKMIGKKFKHHTLATLTKERILDYAAERSKTIKSGTLLKELDSFSRLFKVAKLVWHIPVNNPVPEIRMQLRETRIVGKLGVRDRRPTPSEIDQLIANAKTKDMSDLIQLAIETAMRRSELIRIQRTHINFDNRTLLIPMTKNQVPRTIPLTRKAIEIIEAIPENKTNYLFTCTANTLTNRFNTLKKRLKIENLRFHDLRREGTSRFFERGLQIPEVALITGHLTWKCLEIYTKISPADVAAKLNQCDDF